MQSTTKDLGINRLPKKLEVEANDIDKTNQFLENAFFSSGCLKNITIRPSTNNKISKHFSYQDAPKEIKKILQKEFIRKRK